MYRYVEDSADARRNRLSFVGCGGAPVYDCVLSYKFSAEDTVEPVTLLEAKDWCAVDGSSYDTIIDLLITTAREQVERQKSVSLVNRTVTAKLKPGTTFPFGPVRGITSITDDAGNTYNEFKDAYEDVTVIYTAGFEPGKMPKKYKIMVLQQIAYLLQNRGDEAASGGISPIIKKPK
jgi:hypothetical protein